jgi:hypothetical protein
LPPLGGDSLDPEHAIEIAAAASANRKQLLHDTMLIQCPRCGADDT